MRGAPAMNIYRKKHTPYTYLIGWSWLDIWYYGRRTAKGCHPDEFWVKYWTSSDEVERYRELHGEPDIIIIKKTFGPGETDKCALWETKVLRRLDAAHHPKMLNKKNGDVGLDVTGMFAAILVSTGENLGLISVDDPRRKTGEVKRYGGAKKGKPNEKVRGKFPAIIVATGEKIFVSVDDPRRKTGEIIGIGGRKKGMKPAISIFTGENLGMYSLDHPIWKTGEVIVSGGAKKGTAPAKLASTGENLGAVSLDDPRRKTGEIIGVKTGMKPAVLVATGERLKMVSLLDPRWKTGEIMSAKKWNNIQRKVSIRLK